MNNDEITIAPPGYNRRAPTITIPTDSKKESQHRWYINNAEEHKANVRRNQERIIAENNRKCFEYLLFHPCVDCGESNVVVLQFDHNDPTMKRADVSRMIGQGFSWNTVLEEIEKCVVRCANCHQFKTARAAGYPRYILWMNHIG